MSRFDALQRVIRVARSEMELDRAVLAWASVHARDTDAPPLEAVAKQLTEHARHRPLQDHFIVTWSRDAKGPPEGVAKMGDRELYLLSQFRAGTEE